MPTDPNEYTVTAVCLLVSLVLTTIIKSRRLGELGITSLIIEETEDSNESTIYPFNLLYNNSSPFAIMYVVVGFYALGVLATYSLSPIVMYTLIVHVVWTGLLLVWNIMIFADYCMYVK
jgi:hypothetical protein